VSWYGRQEKKKKKKSLRMDVVLAQFRDVFDSLLEAGVKTPEKIFQSNG
jgi:hypothetical protein